ILDKINSPQNVIKVAKKGFTFDNSQYDEDMLNQAVSIYIKYAPDDAVNALEDIYKNAYDIRLRGVALFKLSNIAKNPNAAKYKAKFVDSFSGSKYAPELLFELFLDALKANKTPLALKYGKKHLALYKGDDTPLVLYFVALLKKKTADSTYKEQVNKLLEDYTGSYYSYLAYKNLSGKKFPNVSGDKIVYPDEIKFPYQDDKTLSAFFINFANTSDFKPFDDFRINDLLIKSWIEYKKNNKALSSVYARDYIKQSEIPLKRNNPVWQLAYPIYYSKEINYWAQRRGLNPYLILSLIKEESHFNSQIKSEAGAFGLMQLMMPTAQMIAGKSLTTDELTDVNFNIQLGTKYFAYLSDIFSNNEPLCGLSYNSGPNAVKNWIEKSPFLPFDIFVETIPYPETRMYIKKVYGAYWNYLLTWEKIKLHVPL
ncbi:MAG: lytic transglycosylase domain-containing protein, partial [Candidatus Gastranaerophilales bacterium]|nr:lytic transglycosylase domain-containing protein [Candidatus Gastranaerophilales bacterium]